MKIIIPLLFVSSLAVACDKGCFPYEGLCACEKQAVEVTASVDVKPSDEQVPKDKMPSYQREGIHADEQKPCNDTDHKCSDQLQIDAANQGMKAAGIKPCRNGDIDKQIPCSVTK